MSLLRGVLWETAAVGALGALLLADSSVASAARRALAKCLGQSPPQLVWVVLAFFSWFCGRMNSSLAVLLVSVLPLISVVQSTLDDKALSKVASKLDRTGGSSGDQGSAKAFGNAVLGAMWADFVGPVVAARVKKALNGTLSKRNFPALKSLEVKQCHAGENPPELRTCEASVTGDGTLQIMGKMEFHAGHDFVVQLKARWARKLESLPPLAIHITGVRVSGSVLIRARKFTEEKPHVEHLSFSFIEAPKVSFNIEPMGKRSLDITLLPGMRSWLDKLISSGLERHVVWPQKIVVDSSQKRSKGGSGDSGAPLGLSTPKSGGDVTTRKGFQKAAPSPKIDVGEVGNVEAELEAELLNLKDGEAVSLFREGEQKIIKEGWLQKEGAKVKTIKRRYFCLLQGSLIYYEDDNRKVCRGEIALSHETKVIAMEHNKRKQLQGLCGFAVTHGQQNREKIILATEDGEAGRRSWIEQIRLAADPARVSEQPGIAGANAVASDTATGQSLPRVRSGSRPGDGAEDISSPSRSSAIDDSSSTPSTPRGSEAESEGGASIEAPPPESSLRRELPDGSFEEENSTEEPAPAAWPTRRDEEEEELLARPEWEANSPPMSNLEGGLPLTRARSSGLSAGLESPLKFSGVAEELVAAEPLEGWLHKRGRAVKSVRRRYFVLGGEDLRYYEDESKASCKGEIPLSAQSRVLTANALNGAPAFALTYGPGENMIILAAEGSEERQRWMESLRNAVGRLETIRK